MHKIPVDIAVIGGGRLILQQQLKAKKKDSKKLF